jgi:hypothetical protein
LTKEAGGAVEQQQDEAARGGGPGRFKRGEFERSGAGGGGLELTRALYPCRFSEQIGSIGRIPAAHVRSGVNTPREIGRLPRGFVLPPSGGGTWVFLSGMVIRRIEMRIFARLITIPSPVLWRVDQAIP